MTPNSPTETLKMTNTQSPRQTNVSKAFAKPDDIFKIKGVASKMLVR